MNINDWYLFQGVNSVIGFHRVVGPRLLGLTPDEGAIAAAMPKAHAVFNELSRLLGMQRYFAGQGVTLADLLLAPQLDFLAQTPEWVQLSAGNRNLVDWLERMNARDSLKATTWERVADMAKAA
jgi:glutathione S-transferase